MIWLHVDTQTERRNQVHEQLRGWRLIMMTIMMVMMMMMVIIINVSKFEVSFKCFLSAL